MAKKPTIKELQGRIEVLEEQLADSENQLTFFRQFVEYSGEGMGWADTKTIVRYVNPTLCKMFGEEHPDDIYGRSVLDFYPKESQEKISNEVFPVVLREGHWTGELSIRSEGGGQMVTTNTLHAIRDKDGNPVAFANVLTDITDRIKFEDELRLHRDRLQELVSERTKKLIEINNALSIEISERKQMEEALRESESRFREMTERLPVSVFETDDKLNLSYANKMALGLFKFTKEDFDQGIPLLSVIAPEDHGRLAGNYEKIVAGETIGLNEYAGIKNDGTTLPILVHSDVIYKDGVQQGLRGIALDITDLKLAEERLQQSEARYRTLIEHMQDGIFVLQDETIAFANDAFIGIIGYTADELIGKNFRRFIAPEDLQLVADRNTKRQRGEAVPNSYETTFVHKDGRRVFVNITVGLIQFEGRMASLGTVKDITEQRRTEEEMKKVEMKLRHAQRMESLGTLTGGIAHNFNNVLMGIQGKTSTLLLGKNTSDPDFEHLKAIENFVHTASTLTRELLGYGRGGKYEIRVTDLNNILKHQARIFGQTRKEITIRESYCDDLWQTAVDRAQMEQVFLNLFINAWQAMPSGGKLFIQTENVTMGAHNHPNLTMVPGEYVKVTVTDTGHGIDKEIIDKIFEPFFSTKKTGTSTGLGLASVYGIVKNHDGYVFAYSEEGQGTTFSIYIPRTGHDVVERFEPLVEKAKDRVPGTGQILLVDDEEMIREVCRELLESLGYQVIVATTGSEAIAIYRESHANIDMVILDMIMSEMSGETTYMKLKETNPEVRVLLSSGYSENEDVKRILDMGCRGFIQKPFSVELLSHKIKEILE